jgi:hypothetical protein
VTAADRPDNGQGEGLWPQYFCPTSGQVEDAQHGGFDVCCDRPDLHRPATSGRAGAGEQQRDAVALWLLNKYPDAYEDWGSNERADADELLALLGGPQPDGAT